MSYYDDEEEQGRPQGGQGQQGRQPGLRADFRADPGMSPRASYQQQPPRHPQDPAQLQAHPSQHDPYADQPDPYVDPEPAAGYRAPAPDPYYDPYVGPDSQYEGHEGGYEAEAPPRRRGIINAAIVAGGLAVFGGIIFYAYNQGMRAGTESVAPILRADTSPTKIKPENPGGMEVPNQDKLIYDRLNPGGTETGQVERLLPPPEAPMQRPQAEPVLPPEEGEMPMAEAGEGQVTAHAPPQPLYPPQQQQPAPGAVPQQQQPAYQPTTPAPQPLYQPQQQAPATAPPVVQQPRPQPRPESLLPPPAPTRTAPVPTPTPATPPVAATVAPKPTTGTVRVQVAAVDAEGKAASEWARLQRKFPELAGLPMRTVRADLGAKGVFYRIQGGPVDEARAKQICAALAAQGSGCVLVR